VIEIQRQHIKSEFKNLQTFLHEEEKCYLWRLEKEEEQMLRRIKASEANLEQKSNELSNHILELEAKCQGSVQNLLQVRLWAWSRERKYVTELVKEEW
jgi:tripartite motif-containing protein 38